MEELVSRISAQTGLPPEMARQAAQVVIDFIKERAPEPIKGQIDPMINNPQFGAVAGQALDALGGLFGKKDDDEKK